jgi:hypothetical protein
MIAQALDAIRSWIESYYEGTDPQEVKFPGDHPLAGQPAGHLVLQRKGPATAVWEFIKAPREDIRPLSPHQSLSVNHTFLHIGSLKEWLAGAGKPLSVFIRTRQRESAIVRVVAEEKPDDGTVMAEVARSGSFNRWFSVLNAEGEKILGHEVFAQLLLTNIGDLADDKIAKLVATIQTAKTVGFDSDEEGNSNVRVEWKQERRDKSTGAAIRIPSEFTAKIRPYAASGIWEAGKEPVLEAHFWVRVLPPNRDDAPAPRYQVLFVNADEYMTQSQELLLEGMKKQLGAKVFLGAPSVERFQTPA